MTQQIAQLWQDNPNFQDVKETTPQEVDIRHRVHEHLTLAQSEIQVSLDLVKLLLSRRQQSLRVGNLDFPTSLLKTHRVQVSKEQNLKFVMGAKYQELGQVADNLLESSQNLRQMMGNQQWRRAFELKQKNWLVARQRDQYWVDYGMGTVDIEKMETQDRLKVAVKGCSLLETTPMGEDLDGRLKNYREAAYDRDLFQKICREARDHELGSMVANGEQQTLVTAVNRESSQDQLQWTMTDGSNVADGDWQRGYQAGIAQTMASLYQLKEGKILPSVLRSFEFSQWQRFLVQQVRMVRQAWWKLIREPIEILSHLSQTHTTKGECHEISYTIRLRFPGGTVMAIRVDSGGHLYFVKGYFPPSKDLDVLVNRVFRIVALSGQQEFIEFLQHELQSLVLLRVAACMSSKDSQWLVHQSQMCVVGEGPQGSQWMGVVKWTQEGLVLWFGPKHPLSGQDWAQHRYSETLEAFDKQLLRALFDF